MRLYDGRSVNRFLDRRFKSHAPGRDAIVWDYDDINMTVRCKIQGSNEYIVCHYPRNFRTKEEWCKRGNAVRIEHKGGIRGYLEVVGHGRAIPSPVSGATFPTAETLSDGIISGGTVTPFNSMTVEIDATTYRIDGTLYFLNQDADFFVMGDDSLGAMGSAGSAPMGASFNQYVTLDAAPSVGLFRYDLIVAGTDSSIDVIKGDEVASDPVMPAIPADHVRIAHIFMIGGITEIGIENINTLWESRRLTSLAIAFSNGSGSDGGTIQNDKEFVFHETSDTPYCVITATFKDQYGWAFSESRSTTMALVYGTGKISYSPLEGWATSDVTRTSSGSTVTFYYQRDQLATEISEMMFSFSIEDDIITGVAQLTLLPDPTP